MAIGAGRAGTNPVHVDRGAPDDASGPGRPRPLDVLALATMDAPPVGPKPAAAGRGPSPLTARLDVRPQVGQMGPGVAERSLGAAGEPTHAGTQPLMARVV